MNQDDFRTEGSFVDQENFENGAGSVPHWSSFKKRLKQILQVSPSSTDSPTEIECTVLLTPLGLQVEDAHCVCIMCLHNFRQESSDKSR